EKAIYDPGILNTNIDDFNSLSHLLIKGASVSGQITITEIEEILKSKKYQAFYTGFGYLPMFKTRRKLISNYQEISKTKVDKEIKVFEETRKEDFLYVKEDNYGTSLYRSNILLIDKYINRLKQLDYLLLESIFLDDEIMVDALKLYKGIISATFFKEKYSSYTFDDGFFNKELIYKKGD
ncbi:hypothetical protein LJC17_04920, partial [Acholeplasma sp. OttesenSCG-928-E16]|nr:hypothetical protein [Acholeplasma sp. OttesenSCG-928-E16]